MIDAEYIVKQIDEAISNKYVKVYLQPIYRTLTNDICEFEALARWEDPVYGLLSPIDFIPALEEANEIYKVDLYMITEVCKSMRQRLDQGKLIFPVSFNLSRKDILKCDVFEEVFKIADQYKVSSEYIQIEITESAFLEDTKAIITMAETFRSRGVEVWMDDFGEGYSSLNMISSCDFDLVKLDMGFMRRFNEKTQIVLANVVRMAKQLGIHTLSEGVETEEQYHFLQQIGCEKVQGYYFSKPLRMDEAFAYLDANSKFKEDRDLAKYFDKIGQVEFTTDKALIIYELIDDQIKTLFCNKQVLDEIYATGISSIEELEALYNYDGNPHAVHFREYLRRIDDTDQMHQYDYTAWNYYIRYRVNKIATHENHIAFKTEVTMLSSESKTKNVLNNMPESTFYELPDECMIGVEEIDNEHKYFFVLANQAVEAIKNIDFVSEDAKSIILKIQNYAHTHFEHEEAYMEKINDPSLSIQKLQHQQFIEIADAINPSSYSKEEYIETVNYIVQWLYKHIIKSDTLIGKNEASRR